MPRGRKVGNHPCLSSFRMAGRQPRLLHSKFVHEIVIVASVLRFPAPAPKSLRQGVPVTNSWSSYMSSVYYLGSTEFILSTTRTRLAIKYQMITDVCHGLLAFPALELSLIYLGITVYDLCPKGVAKMPTALTSINSVFIALLMNGVFFQYLCKLRSSHRMDEIDDVLRRIEHHTHADLEVFVIPTVAA